MATHSSTLAWKIPWTEDPGRLQSMGSLRVGHDWSDLAAAAWSNYKLRRNTGTAKPVAVDVEAWWAAVYGVAQSWTRLKWLSSSSNMYTFKWKPNNAKKCIIKNSNLLPYPSPHIPVPTSIFPWLYTSIFQNTMHRQIFFTVIFRKYLLTFY